MSGKADAAFPRAGERRAVDREILFSFFTARCGDLVSMPLRAHQTTTPRSHDAGADRVAMVAWPLLRRGTFTASRGECRWQRLAPPVTYFARSAIGSVIGDIDKMQRLDVFLGDPVTAEIRCVHDCCLQRLGRNGRRAVSPAARARDRQKELPHCWATLAVDGWLRRWLLRWARSETTAAIVAVGALLAPPATFMGMDDVCAWLSIWRATPSRTVLMESQRHHLDAWRRNGHWTFDEFGIAHTFADGRRPSCR